MPEQGVPRCLTGWKAGLFESYGNQNNKKPSVKMAFCFEVRLSCFF